MKLRCAGGAKKGERKERGPWRGKKMGRKERKVKTGEGVEKGGKSASARRHIILLLAVWLSGNALASINVVAPRQTRLVLGWVTVCGPVNHFGM